MWPPRCLLFFFFNDTATTEIYTLSLHDALPICWCAASRRSVDREGRNAMRNSDTRILISHVGSLPRPEALIDANRARDAGETADGAAFQEALRAAVTDVVRHQRELGIDVPNDGEF